VNKRNCTIICHLQVFDHALEIESFFARIPIAVLLGLGEARVLKDEVVVSPGWVGHVVGGGPQLTMKELSSISQSTSATQGLKEKNLIKLSR